MLPETELYDFIKSVSSSNLETFHSKAIAWMFNSFKADSPFFIRLYLEATGESSKEVRHVVTKAEIKSHDLVTVLNVNGRNEIIIFENKIKAGFHQKKWNLKNQDWSLMAKYESNWRRGISQPYYYQLAYLKNPNAYISELSNKIENSMEYEALRTMDGVKVHWLVLSPFTEFELNQFYSEQWCGLSGFTTDKTTIKSDRELVSSLSQGITLNRWRFTSYKKLFDNLDFKEPNLNEVQLAYIECLEREKWFRQKKAIDKDLAKGREWSVDDLLKVREEVANAISDPIFRWNVSGSANSGGALLNICFPQKELLTPAKIDQLGLALSENINNQSASSSLVNRLSINVQLQGNAIKLQLSHWDYDNAKIKKSEKGKTGSSKYTSRVIKECLGIDCSIDKEKRKSLVDEWLQGSGFKTHRENPCKTKTGFSFSLIPENEVSNDIVLRKNIITLCKHIAKKVR